MTIKVSRVDGVQIPAAQDRRALYGGQTTGIVYDIDGLVGAQATPNMTTKVDPIRGVLIDDGVSGAVGKLVFESDAVVNVTHATANATNPRIDLVVARVKAVEFGDPSDSFTLEAVTGTPGASPSAPAAPTRSYALAEVRVDAGVTTIQANKITDRRALSTLIGLSREGCRLHKAASSVASGSATAISWSDVDPNPSSLIGPPATTITIPSSGVYTITGNTVASSSITGRCFVELLVTTTLTNMPTEYRNTMEAVESRGIVTASIPLEAGDSFTFRVFHSTGASRTFESFLTCYRTSV